MIFKTGWYSVDIIKSWTGPSNMSSTINSQYLNRIPTREQKQKRLSCLLPVDSYHGTTIVTSDYTIVTSCHHGSIRTTFISNNSTTQKTCNRKYTWLPFLLLPPSRYSIRGTENFINTIYMLTTYLPSHYLTVTQFQYILTISIAWLTKDYRSSGMLQAEDVYICLFNCDIQSYDEKF